MTFYECMRLVNERAGFIRTSHCIILDAFASSRITAGVAMDDCDVQEVLVVSYAP